MGQTYASHIGTKWDCIVDVIRLPNAYEQALLELFGQHEGEQYHNDSISNYSDKAGHKFFSSSVSGYRIY